MKTTGKQADSTRPSYPAAAVHAPATAEPTGSGWLWFCYALQVWVRDGVVLEVVGKGEGIRGGTVHRACPSCH